ncbi:MAG: hypothetical protein EPO62_01795 [Candidatus Nitrosotenuis sp.]|nr:MAG: hypothetical protein EPO62_01795 [Candidatus Nitrosotenuis sp.]
MTLIDKTAAIRAATQFLKQHFSVQEIDAVLEGTTWVATAQIVAYDNIMLEKIRIDAVTGRLEGYELPGYA